MKREDGRAILVTGASGSGKSAWTVQQIKRAGAPRLLVWDSLGEWSRLLGIAPAPTLGALAAQLKQHAARGLVHSRACYVGPVTRGAFDTFCRIAWAWLKLAPGVLVVEELADVTSPGKAPPAWGEIVRKGRHLGATVYALTQRPAESDKTIVSNAALIHAGMAAFDADRLYMARCLDVPADEVRALQRLQWIERDMRTRALTRGALTFKARHK